MAIVLYASETQLSENHVPIVVKGWRLGEDKTIYVRAELNEDAWPGPAMDSARPWPGEVALNAVPNSVVIVPKLKNPSLAELAKPE